MKKLLLVCLALFIAVIPAISAVQPTQQYNKILLTPFYVPSMTQNIYYNYNVSVITPDGISGVRTAILTLDAWINPTRTFYAWMNGIPCNTPSYVVSTTYAGAGRAVLTFDCTNAIIPNKVNNVTFRVTGGNIGASTAWLDLTYMNSPLGDIDIQGTEYSPDDPATIFLQLKDTYGNPIQNGSCYLDIWYPLINGTHPYTLQDAPMLPALGDDGLYYYDMVAPTTLGVYMLSAKCSYAFDWIWFYPDSEAVFHPIQQINSGTWLGDAQVLNSKRDVLYQRCDGSIAQPCNSNYTFNLSTYGTVSNISNINIYFSGQSDTYSRTLVMAYWNGTAFVNLTNTLAWSGTGGSVPSGYDEFLTNSIPLNAIINNTIKVRLSTAGSVRVFYNWLSIVVLSSAGNIQDLKGSSEMHITNIPNATSALISNLTVQVNSSVVAEQVWNYSSRNLTYYPDVSVVVQNITLNLTTQNVSVQNVSMNTSQIAYDVWNYSGVIVPNILNQIASIVWNYVGRYVHGILY